MHLLEGLCFDYFSENQVLMSECAARTREIVADQKSPKKLREALLRIPLPGMVVRKEIQARLEKEGESSVDAHALSAVMHEQAVFLSAYQRTRCVYKVPQELLSTFKAGAMYDPILVSDIPLPTNGLVIEFPGNHYMGCYFDLKPNYENEGAILLHFVKITEEGCEALAALDLSASRTISENLNALFEESMENTSGYLSEVLRQEQEHLISELKSQIHVAVHVLCVIDVGTDIVRQPGSDEPAIFVIRRAS